MCSSWFNACRGRIHQWPPSYRSRSLGWFGTWSFFCSRRLRSEFINLFRWLSSCRNSATNKSPTSCSASFAVFQRISRASCGGAGYCARWNSKTPDKAKISGESFKTSNSPSIFSPPLVPSLNLYRKSFEKYSSPYSNAKSHPQNSLSPALNHWIILTASTPLYFGSYIRYAFSFPHWMLLSYCASPMIKLFTQWKSPSWHSSILRIHESGWTST